MLPLSIQTMEDYKYLFKIVLIGNAGVGKTCLVRRFTQGDFPIGLGATIGVDFIIKPMEVNGKLPRTISIVIVLIASITLSTNKRFCLV